MFKTRGGGSKAAWTMFKKMHFWRNMASIIVVWNGSRRWKNTQFHLLWQMIFSKNWHPQQLLIDSRDFPFGKLKQFWSQPHASFHKYQDIWEGSTRNSHTRGISSEPNRGQILQNHQIHQFYQKLQIHQFLSFHIVVSVSVSASVIIFAIITHLRKLCVKVKCRKLLKTRFFHLFCGFKNNRVSETSSKLKVWFCTQQFLACASSGVYVYYLSLL